MEVTHGRGYVYSIQYHVVWCVKYRHKILTLKIENRLVELLYQVARENNFQIIECNTDKDHIHYMIETNPNTNISNLVKMIKSYTTFHIWKNHEKFLSKHFWKENTFLDGWILCMQCWKCF